MASSGELDPQPHAANTAPTTGQTRHLCIRYLLRRAVAHRSCAPITRSGVYAHREMLSCPGLNVTGRPPTHGDSEGRTRISRGGEGLPVAALRVDRGVELVERRAGLCGEGGHPGGITRQP